MNRHLIALAMACAAMHFNHHAHAARFDVFGPVYSFGETTRLSDDGAVLLVGPGPGREGFLWSVSQGFIRFYDDNLGDIFPRGLSGDGQTVVGGTPFGSLSAGWDASFDGSVIVGVRQAGANFVAFQTINGGPVLDLGDLPGGDIESAARAVSADGKTIVGYGWGPFDRREPFRFTAADGMQPLGPLPGGDGLRGEAADVSGDGSVIVGRTLVASNAEAFRWTAAGGVELLGDLPGGRFYSEAFAVSADSQTIVGRSVTTNNSEAFIWDATHGMRNLADVLVNEYNVDLQGMQLRMAGGVSADGRVFAGIGTRVAADNTVDTYAWRVDLGPIPEPSCFILLTLGALSLGLMRRR